VDRNLRQSAQAREEQVKLSELSESQFRRYFEVRLADNRFRKSHTGHMALCPFHPDKTPSLSVSTEKGAWKCHAGCGAGGVIDFEMMWSKCDKDTALTRIAEIVGESRLNFGKQPEAIYPYTDAFGKLLFQVVRYPGKRFSQRKPDDNGGWIHETRGMKMVLYNLPDVCESKNVAICEGEKDCDNMKAAIETAKIPHLAVTTSPRGAGKWLDEFSVFMAGKQVMILPDNDEAGRKHAEQVAQSCYRYAQGVKIVECPNVPDKGDVSDYLKTGSIADLLAVAKKTGWWRLPTSETTLFMTDTQFSANASDHIDWIIEGVIERGANGMIISRPKSGKSFTVLDLALALASGQKWLDFFVPKRTRTALVSREDHFGLTQWRRRKVAAARNLTSADLDNWLYFNAKGLKPKIMLDYPDDVKLLIEDLKRYGTEFLILDVMRVLHGAEENDNTEMQKIIDVLNYIQEETKASICLIHHDNKREDASLTERARGASAIAGWAEFICGIRVVDESDWTREFTCELKASMAPDKFYYRIVDTPDDGIELKRVDWSPPTRNGKKKEQDQNVAPF
jgi:5S rRNA maturation endonuclease (ribonuclease M5)